MPCYSPLQGWRSASGPGVTFNRRFAFVDQEVKVPCGRCIGCRLARSSQWATRIAHEASLHSANSFLTLTYSDEHLPSNLSVDVVALQKFMKRLRKALYPAPVRFVACGEYGENTFRPHYHVILFGYAFNSDRQPWKKSGSGHLLYRSSMLQRLWPFGHHWIGQVTGQSGGYVARYTLKKQFGDDERARKAYERMRVDPITGEVQTWSVAREFFVSSRRPGIGAGWLERWSGDVFPSDFVILDGKKKAIPDYYRRKLQAAHTDEERLSGLSPHMEQLVYKRRRENFVRAAHPDNTPARLEARAVHATLEASRIKRDPEKK